MWDEAGRLTEWLGDVPVEAQLLKMSEEVGEAAEAYLGMTGLNPRKGISHTRQDLVGEVGDVIITAAVAIVQLTCSPGAARAAFESHLASVTSRAGLDATTGSDPVDGKLVRDRIPEIIRGDGLDPVITTADPAKYAARLRDKLGEEVAEFLASDGDPMELADILEVVYALAAAGGTGPAELESLRAAKAASNGAFTQRLVWHGNRDDHERGHPDGQPAPAGGE
jgi:predicted house-cleaning noncanonical NTP pyrophosphatase (MazG superfamily)/NTP pyrophosphatase (non-canonical NTP hydrolase)